MFLKMNIRQHDILLTKVLLTRINCLSSFPLLPFYSLSLFFFCLINTESSQFLKKYEDAQWPCSHFGLPLPANESCLCLEHTLTHFLVFFWMIGDLDHKKFTGFSVFIPLNSFHLHFCIPPMNCPYLFL